MRTLKLEAELGMLTYRTIINGKYNLETLRKVEPILQEFEKNITITAGEGGSFYYAKKDFVFEISISEEIFELLKALLKGIKDCKADVNSRLILKLDDYLKDVPLSEPKKEK